MNAIRFDFLILTTLLLIFGLILLSSSADGSTNKIKMGFDPGMIASQD